MFNGAGWMQASVKSPCPDMPTGREFRRSQDAVALRVLAGVLPSRGTMAEHHGPHAGGCQNEGQVG